MCTKPTPSRSPVHYHPAQEEIFRVLAGELRASIGGEQRTLREGKTLVVPRGTRHEVWDETVGVRVNWRTRPVLRTEALFETVIGLARGGKTNETGIPNLLQAAVSRGLTSTSSASPGRRGRCNDYLFTVLALLGRLLGYSARHPN